MNNNKLNKKSFKTSKSLNQWDVHEQLHFDIMVMYSIHDHFKMSSIFC